MTNNQETLAVYKGKLWVVVRVELSTTSDDFDTMTLFHDGDTVSVARRVLDMAPSTVDKLREDVAVGGMSSSAAFTAVYGEKTVLAALEGVER